MSNPITSVQGLASGIKWQDIIDQLMQVDTANELQPVKDKAAAETKTLSAWSNYGSLSGTLLSTASVLADGSAFGGLSASVSNSGTTGRTLLSATTTTGAVAGTYGVQVLGTAAAQQLSGNVVSDASAALGVSGQFVVAGKVVTLTNTDSLNTLRDKINALDTGDARTNVSASILHTGSANARLVLTSDVGGANGVDIRDARATASDPSVLTQLGFIDGTRSNIGSDGAVRSATFGSQSGKIATMATGVSAFPQPGSITVNGRTVTIDVQNHSLADIAAMINAQSPNTASIETITNNAGVDTFRLKISGTVASTASPSSQPILDILGLTRGTTGLVKQQVATSNLLQDITSATANGSSLLAGLKLAGGSGAQVGDTFTINGTKADGVTKVSFSKTIGASDTVDSLLSDISTAFSSPTRAVSASIVGGMIQLTDEAGGDSGLSFSLSTDNAGGGTLAFGASGITTLGRQRELVAGADTRLLVNGAIVTRSSNTISDAIPGVTLNIQQAEVGTTIPVVVSRDTSRTIQALQNFASAYNAVQSFVTSSTASGGDLAFNGAVRQSFNTLKSGLLTSVAGLAPGSAYSSAALVGVALDRTGKLTIDTDVLGAALAKNPDAVKNLFQTNGATSSADFSYISADSHPASGAYDISITQAATRPSFTSTAANFVYAGALGDTLTIRDSVSGKAGSIAVVNGDTPDTVADKLNTAFRTQGVRLSATNVNGALTITSLDYGSSPSITTSFTSDVSTTDMANVLGLIAGTTRNGLDVQGSFSVGATVYAATGNGQLLTGAVGSPVAGLAMRYAGTLNSATGHVDFAVGIAGLAGRIADQISATNGIAGQQAATLQSDIDSLTERQTTIQTRLDARRAALTKQFTAMETALSKLQAQGQWLTQQLNAMNSLQSNNN
ncbi:MAG TPA: flagellar filament capping protein FliD [Gemmatimonadaceae bacterium]|nr:flagellar filament capping protein FliD [Gemmatimonadaceae bacterium]